MSDKTLAIRETPYLSPAADIDAARARYREMDQFIKSILVDGVDFGTVPGSAKPTLLKPGAEKLASFFGLTTRFDLVERIEDWTGENHGGEPFFYYRYKCQLFKGDFLAAEGEGSCNSWEKKYRYRQAQRLCPECGQPTIFKSKNKPEFYCWQKKGGCGATFPLGDTRITEQEVGQTKNPDPAEQVNTIQKMAQKRALIAPVLIATNASEKFTQDIEDFTDGSFHDITPDKKPATVEITYEQAIEVVGSDDRKYGDCDDADLKGKIAGLQRALRRELSPETQEEYLYKLAAAKTILEHRAAEQKSE